MTTPKEALEFYADPIAWKKQHDLEDNVVVPDFYEETSFGDMAKEALTSLHGEDAVERVARIVDPKAFDETLQTFATPLYWEGRHNLAMKTADAILATGLVPDEAAIRADEREKCAKICEAKAKAFDEVVGHPRSENLRYRSEGMARGAEFSAAAIRSNGRGA